MDRACNITEQHLDMDFFVVKSKIWSSLTSLWLYLFVVDVEQIIILAAVDNKDTL